MNNKDKEQIIAVIKKECDDATNISVNLLRAPEAACIIETLTVLAGCTRDPSLRSGAPDEKFEHLRTPDSFKGCLYQSINSMSDAFRTGHNSVTKIQNNLINMPTLMTDIMEAMENLEDPDSKEVIEYALDTIKSSASNCVKASTDANDEAKKALNVIRELLQFAKATQGRKENREIEMKNEIEEQKNVQAQKERHLKELKETIDRQEKIVNEAMSDYKDKMEKSSDLTLQVGVMLMDSFTSVLETATGAINNVSSFVKHAPNHLMATMQNHISSSTHLKKDDVSTEAWELTLFRLMDSITQENESELTPDNIESHCNELKCILKYKFPTESGKLLRESVMELMTAFSNPEDKKKIFEALAKAKMNVTTVTNMRLSKEKHEDAKIQSDAIKSQERQTLMQTQQKNLEVARSTLHDERERAEVLRKERFLADEKLNETINSLQRLNLEQVDLKDVLEYLQAGVEQLTEVQVAWENVTQFFEHIKLVVDGPLITHVEGFTKLAESNKEKANLTAYIRKIMLRECTKACAVGSVLMQTAELYKAISTQFVFPMIEKSIKNMALTRDEAKVLQRSISSNFKNIKDAVQNTIDNHNGRLPKAVMKSLESQGLSVKLAVEDKKS